jgi:hypothetical protein
MGSLWQWPRTGRVLAIILLIFVALGARKALAQALPQWDFTRPEDAQGWAPTHDIAGLTPTPEGLEILIKGSDPYTWGPPRDYPADLLLWLTLRLKSDQPGIGQVFWFRTATSETNSVRFPVRSTGWEEIRVPLPALNRRYRLRFDPPGTRGKCLLAYLHVGPRLVIQEPAWPAPARPVFQDSPLAIESGDLQLLHDGKSPGGFVLRVAGREMAIGLTRSLIGYAQGDEVRWAALDSEADTTAHKTTEGLQVQTMLRDPDGATWRIEQRFAAAGTPGAIDVETRVTVDQDRSVLFLPMLVLLPGAGSFGASKGQGLFPGLEYLEDEPSSSEADVVGPASKRQVPDSLKITFPLMAVQAEERYVGLIWEREPSFSALFDSPDRLFRSGGHVMGLLFPGSDGFNRTEGSLLPLDPGLLTAGQPRVLRATLIGGTGRSIVPAVQQYVRLRGLPPVPDLGIDAQGYLHLAAHGWLDSKIRQGDLFRHSTAPMFKFSPVCDAPLFMEWMARQTTDASLAQRLAEAARGAISRVGPADYDTARVSHVFYPVTSLIYGNVAMSSRRYEERGQALLTRFEPDGSVLYRPAPGGPDYGRTHFARDADGLTADAVADLLEAATVSGDRVLIAQGLRLLRALDKFRNGVPRGAETWEIPLHTPGLLASAHLIRAYTQGYELTGEVYFLEQARYWAWTGVPFIYLTNPTSQPVGTYATISVLGATNWQFPWFGQPVQWVGLVYADALSRLAPYDPDGPWQRLANGITAFGIQSTWPPSDSSRYGLLPDYYYFRQQIGEEAAINPGTVLANAIRLFNMPALYSFRPFRASGLLVHAPGAIVNAREEPGRVAFTVDGWADHPYYLLVAGLQRPPRVFINDLSADLPPSYQFIAGEGRLILRLEGKPSVAILP